MEIWHLWKWLSKMKDPWCELDIGEQPQLNVDIWSWIMLLWCWSWIALWTFNFEHLGKRLHLSHHLYTRLDSIAFLPPSFCGKCLKMKALLTRKQKRMIGNWHDWECAINWSLAKFITFFLISCIKFARYLIYYLTCIEIREVYSFSLSFEFARFNFAHLLRTYSRSFKFAQEIGLFRRF